MGIKSKEDRAQMDRAIAKRSKYRLDLPSLEQRVLDLERQVRMLLRAQAAKD